MLRYDAEEKNYSNTKIEAENKLVKAEDTLENNKKAKSMEIAKLTAQLRKTEMSISSLEKEIDQKVILARFIKIKPFISPEPGKQGTSNNV